MKRATGYARWSGIAVALLSSLGCGGDDEGSGDMPGNRPPAGPPFMATTEPLSLSSTGTVNLFVELAGKTEAEVDQKLTTAVNRFSGVFVVRPEHNPIGPFDFGTVYDEASDRRRTVAELIRQGYADAYREFIEPIAAAGERAEEPELSRRL